MDYHILKNSNLLNVQHEKNNIAEETDDICSKEQHYHFVTLPFPLSSSSLYLNCWKYYKNLSIIVNEIFKPSRLSPNKIKVVRSRRRCYSTTTCTSTFVILMFFVISLFFVSSTLSIAARKTTSNGIFIQMPYSSPPTVRPPPYDESSEICPAINLRENWIDTICGDLNKGYIPTNPLGHKFPDGSSYPFEIIKNKTLGFFRHALPVLKTDKSLPKVARFNPYEDYQLSPPIETNYRRTKRSSPPRRSPKESLQEVIPWDIQSIINGTTATGDFKAEPRSGQMLRNRFCENPTSFGGLFCKMYNTMWGKTPHFNQNYNNNPHNYQHHQQRYENSNENGGNKRQQYPQRNYMHMSQQPQPQPQQQQQLQYEALHQVEPTPLSSDSSNMPATPCPSSAEYLTPVFARNHEGAWRYVVQIPREGYFTQTVEVTKCAEMNCYYMDGSCRTSPRWQSLLVAEMFYPDKAFPLSSPAASSIITTTNTGSDVIDDPNENNFQIYQKHLQKRRAKSTSSGGGNNNNNNNNNGNDLSTEQIPPECDGLDEIGCFQVRLFYDWFLIPGSCKCWRRQFDFTRIHQSH